MQNQQTSRFPKYQDLYFKITFVMIILSGALFAIGYLLVQAVTAAPTPLIQFALALLYYHAFHFFYGIFSLIYYFAKVKKKIQNGKIYKTILGIILSPASAIVCYAAIMLIAFSSCASD